MCPGPALTVTSVGAYYYIYILKIMKLLALPPKPRNKADKNTADVGVFS